MQNFLKTFEQMKIIKTNFKDLKIYQKQSFKDQEAILENFLITN